MRLFKLNRRKFVCLACLLCVGVLLLSGCATQKVWEEGQFARFYEPAIPSHLELYQSSQPGDMLVLYDESSDTNEKIRRRAYWLQRNNERIKAKRKPVFVPVKTAATLSSIPVLEPAVRSAVSSNNRPYALISSPGSSFTIHTPGPVATYDLPVYQDLSGRLKQVAITPIAVAADLTIVGGFLFVWVWSSGGLNSVH